MWSHYSANHKGFCIEFNANLDLDGINPLDVIYVNDFLQAEYYKDGKDSIFHMIFTKAKDWEYENELRIIKNKLFTEDSRKIPFRKNDIKSIYFGVNTTKLLKEKILKITEEVYQNKINIYEGLLSDSSFEILWNKIN